MKGGSRTIVRIKSANLTSPQSPFRNVVLMKNTEIERKFLVVSDSFVSRATRQYEIEQGYLSKEPARTIRVRIRDTRAFLTIKSTENSQTLERFEWEKEIDVQDARQLLALCLPGVISKTRYIVPADEADLKWEVDVFHGSHEGLRIAELELPAADTPFRKPDFVGEEVTGNPAYYNANL